jgi:hypothetical protein
MSRFFRASSKFGMKKKLTTLLTVSLNAGAQKEINGTQKEKKKEEFVLRFKFNPSLDKDLKQKSAFRVDLFLAVIFGLLCGLFSPLLGLFASSLFLLLRNSFGRSFGERWYDVYPTIKGKELTFFEGFVKNLLYIFPSLAFLLGNIVGDTKKDEKEPNILLLVRVLMFGFLCSWPIFGIVDMIYGAAYSQGFFEHLVDIETNTPGTKIFQEIIELMYKVIKLSEQIELIKNGKLEGDLNTLENTRMVLYEEALKKNEYLNTLQELNTLQLLFF